MKIVLTESQLANIIEVNRFHSMNDIQRIGSNKPVNFELVGVYGIKDYTEFQKIYPFKTLRKIGFGTSTSVEDNTEFSDNWKSLTHQYPVVIIKIPIDVLNKTTFSSNYYKNINKDDSYTLTNNNLFVLFVFNGNESYGYKVNQWYSRKIWFEKQSGVISKKVGRMLSNQKIDDFVNNLHTLSFLKEDDPQDVASKLYSILINIPKTNPKDLYYSDDDINREFREAVRFTVTNGDNPKPILDKIIKKYGRLTKSIEDILTSTDLVVRKYHKPNPYL